MSNLDLYCVTDKELPFLENFSYKLAGVGKNKFNTKYMKCDFGDHIFYKEKNYSELTFHYWFWKNRLSMGNENWVGFCQKRRFWIKKESVGKKIDISNFHKNLLSEVPNEWKNYDAIICEPISVNKVKKIKMIKRGFRSIIKKPKIFFDEKKQNLLFHFDMHHGYGNLKKAIDLMNIEDKNDFLNFVNTSTFFNPHIMFISKPKIANAWFNALFEWLFRCEKVFGLEDLKGYDSQRIYAYLAERYLSFWFTKHCKTLSWPWTLFDPK